MSLIRGCNSFRITSDYTAKMDGKNCKLSKNVLQMKFMQRSVLRLEEEKNAEDKQRVIDDEHWVLDLPQLSKREEKYLTQPSFAVCENLQFGRMSFSGFNQEIEKLMKAYNTDIELRAAEEREKEIGVSEVDMAKRYTTLMSIIAKKFATKRKRSANAADISDSETSVTPPKESRTFWKPCDS